MLRVTEKGFIAPMYQSPAVEERPFHFVDAGQLHEEDRESLLEFVKDKTCPTVDRFPLAVYSWDFYKWLRSSPKKEVRRSINRIGVGYCGACGEFTRFSKDEKERWKCPLCGYKSLLIRDRGYEKGATNGR